MLKSDFDGYEDYTSFNDAQLEFWADEGCRECGGTGKFWVDGDWYDYGDTFVKGPAYTIICECGYGNFSDYSVAVKGEWRHFRMPRPDEWRHITAQKPG